MVQLYRWGSLPARTLFVAERILLCKHPKSIVVIYLVNSVALVSAAHALAVAPNSLMVA